MLGAIQAGIRAAESGTPEGDYAHPGTLTRHGYARGAYGMLERNFENFAKAAGVADADMADPVMQDKVAAFMLERFMERYADRPELVAVAWYAGAEAADTYARNGFTGVDDIADDETREYVNKVMEQVRANPTAPARGTMSSSPSDSPIAEVPPTPSSDVRMRGLVSAASKAVAGGERVDYRTLGQAPTEPTEPTEPEVE